MPLALFAENRRRLREQLGVLDSGSERRFVLLQGGSEQGLCKGDSSDMVSLFRQESFFHWAFGVLEPDFFGGLDVETGESHLFVPRLPKDYAIWMGRIKTKEEFKNRYAQLHYVHAWDRN